MKKKDENAINYAIIGNRIRTRRKNLKYNQEALAAYLDVTPSYISQIECGATKISLDTLSVIAEFLGCDIVELIKDSNILKTENEKSDFIILYDQLNGHEKKLLYELLKTYYKEKLDS